MCAGGCDGEHWSGATGVAEGRACGLEPIDADRCVCAYSAVDGLREVGLGYEGWRRGAGTAAAVRVRNGAEWAHSPGDAEGRGQRRVSYGGVYGVSAARAGDGAESRADDCSRRAVGERTGSDGRECDARAASSCGG